MRILVTGAAGFIGYHLCDSLLNQNHQVVGLDNLNNYYDVNLKLERLKRLGIVQNSFFKVKDGLKGKRENFSFYKVDICNYDHIESIFENNNFDIVIHLAAQAGVRYSITNPDDYIKSNLTGFYNVISLANKSEVKHFLYASSSSVYGNNNLTPFSTFDNTDFPISLYAATKKSNELIAHTFSHLLGLKTTGLRFFTVYGPWGRPDMAYYKFTSSILNKKSIPIHNRGDLSRDFTYISDIIKGINTIISKGHIPNTETQNYSVYNIGRGSPVRLLDFVKSIEIHLNIKANLDMLPMQDGDVYSTWADIKDLQENYGYSPQTNLDYGIRSFVEWYQKFYT